MSPKVELHIGMGKTGTTSIQQYLHQNMDHLLSAHGILYPRRSRLRIGRNCPDHRALAWSISDYYSKMFRFELSDSYWEETRDEFGSSGAHRMILSSEFLWSLGDGEIERIRYELQGHDVRVIIYMRNIRSRIISGYKQSVKIGKMTHSFRTYAESRLERYDYCKMLSKWENVFGADNIVIRLYEKVRKDVVGDFCSMLDLPVLESVAVRQNISPSDSIIQMILRLNRIEKNTLLKKTGLIRGVRRKMLESRSLAGAMEKPCRFLFRAAIVPPADIDWLREATAGMRQEFAQSYLNEEDRSLYEF